MTLHHNDGSHALKIIKMPTLKNSSYVLKFLALSVVTICIHIHHYIVLSVIKNSYDIQLSAPHACWLTQAQILPQVYNKIDKASFSIYLR